LGAVFAQEGVGPAQVAQGDRFAVAVFDLSGQGQGLFALVDRLVVVVQFLLCAAQAGRGRRSHVLVSDLLGEGQCLLEVVDRFGGAAAVSIGAGQVRSAATIRRLSSIARSQGEPGPESWSATAIPPSGRTGLTPADSRAALVRAGRVL